MGEPTPKSEPGFSPLNLLDIDFELSDTRAELVKKVRWIIRVRFAVSAAVVALMAFTGWQGLTQQQTLTRSAFLATVLTGLIAAALNCAYYLALRRQRNLRGFVVLQLALDVLLFTSYVYRSGGVTSPFCFLYLLPIIAGAMLVSGPVAFGLATLASACFGAVALLEGTGAVAHVSYFVDLDSFAQRWSFVLLMLIVNPFAFLAVAGLSSFLMGVVCAKNDELTAANVKLDRRAHLLEMLYDVSRSAVDSASASKVVDAIGKILVAGLQLDRVLLYLAEGDGEGEGEEGPGLVLAREFVADRGGQRGEMRVAIPLEREAGVTAICALERRAINVEDPTDHPLINRELAERIGVNPFAVAPMVFRGELLGVIGIDRRSDLGVIDNDAFLVLVAFADQAAAALGMSQLEGH